MKIIQSYKIIKCNFVISTQYYSKETVNLIFFFFLNFSGNRPGNRGDVQNVLPEQNLEPIFLILRTAWDRTSA